MECAFLFLFVLCLLLGGNTTNERKNIIINWNFIIEVDSNFHHENLIQFIAWFD